MTLVGLLSYVVFPVAGIFAVIGLRSELRKWIGVIALVLAIGGLSYAILVPPSFQCSVPAAR